MSVDHDIVKQIVDLLRRFFELFYSYTGVATSLMLSPYVNTTPLWLVYHVLGIDYYYMYPSLVLETRNVLLVSSHFYGVDPHLGYLYAIRDMLMDWRSPLAFIFISHVLVVYIPIEFVLFAHFSGILYAIFCAYLHPNYFRYYFPHLAPARNMAEAIDRAWAEVLAPPRERRRRPVNIQNLIQRVIEEDGPIVDGVVVADLADLELPEFEEEHRVPYAIAVVE